MKKRKKEGRRIRSLCPMNYVGLFIMPKRSDATIFYADRVEVTKAEEYIRQKKKEGLADFNMMYLLLSAYIRNVAEHPEINRFVRGQRIYARNGVFVMMTIKLSMEVNAPETVLKVEFPPDATAEQVYHTLHEEILKARQGNTEFDGTANFYSHMPRLLMRFFMHTIECLDYFGIMPRALTNISPFHASFALTSTGSLRIQPVFHHLYNFGTTPLFCSFGNGYLEYSLNEEGEKVKKKFVDLHFTMDERITDGFGYATVFHRLKYILQNPALLDTPPAEVRRDID